MSKQFDLLKKPKNGLSAEEHFDSIGKFGCERWMRRFDLIKG